MNLRRMALFFALCVSPLKCQTNQSLAQQTSMSCEEKNITELCSEKNKVTEEHSQKKKVIGAAATGAVVGAVGTPLVVATGVSSLGFTSVGISAGSTAASMMAASGGSVAAGGLVATLQSIGMAGLGLGATISFAGFGALAVAPAFAGIASLVHKKMTNLYDEAGSNEMNSSDPTK